MGYSQTQEGRQMVDQYGISQNGTVPFVLNRSRIYNLEINHIVTATKILSHIVICPLSKTVQRSNIVRNMNRIWTQIWVKYGFNQRSDLVY